jgi:hypothetical protein
MLIRGPLGLVHFLILIWSFLLLAVALMSCPPPLFCFRSSGLLPLVFPYMKSTLTGIIAHIRPEEAFRKRLPRQLPEALRHIYSVCEFKSHVRPRLIKTLFL